MAGRILELKLSDFMTYTHGIFCPEPGLNVIIGPNGTGKSTLVCAMVLALSSKPKTLGRASNLGSYVRIGCPQATIEITLSGKRGEEHVIKRVIKRDGTSSWALNGSSCSYKAVEHLVSKLNIQVDNLCQFLPQERVQDFARMNPQALLDNTIKCTGTERMMEDFERLKELRRTELTLEKEIAALSEKLDGLEQQNSRREVHVENMRQKNTMKKKIENMKQKLAWLRYDVIRTDLTQAKATKKKAIEQLKEYQKQVEPLRKKQMVAIKEQEKVQEMATQCERDVNSKLNNVRSCREQVEHLMQKVDDAKRELNAKIAAEEQRQKDATAVKLSIEFMQMNISDAEKQPGVDPAELRQVKNSIQQKVEEIGNLSAKKIETQSQVETVLHKMERAQSELNSIQNVFNQRLQILQRAHPDAYQAIQWLRENKDQFRQTIHEPMKLLINVKDSANAKYLESMINDRDLEAFTCENKEDMNKFLKIVSEDLKLKVNVVAAPETIDTSRPYSLEQLKKFGFWTFVSDLFTAPQAIMNYLCKSYRLHQIPIGNKVTEKMTENIPAGVTTFFTEKHRFNARVSKYSGEKVTRTMELRQARFLCVNVDTARLQRVQQNLNNLNEQKVNLDNECLNVQTALDECKGEIAQLRDKQNALLKQQDYINQMKLKLKMKQRELDQLERQALDVEAAKTACQKNIEKTVEKLVSLEIQVVENLDKCHSSFTTRLMTKIQLRVGRKQISMLENKSKDLQSKERELQAHVEDINKMLENVKAKAYEALAAAKALTNNIIPNEPGFAPYTKAFEKLPDTVEELDAAIQNLQSKIDCIGDTDDALVKLFENTKMEIKSITKTLDNRKNELEKTEQEMETLKNTWLPTVKDLVSQINATYSKCFNVLGSAGEVDLSFGKTENDFEDYGLRIRVKFRMEESLCELSRFLQSGGERAVATAVYMISLQELTKVPFCCVDEINQGMDIQNETMICDLLVATTSREDSAQYFLLTPKKPPAPLLKGKGATTIIFNGYAGLNNVYNSYRERY